MVRVRHHDLDRISGSSWSASKLRQPGGENGLGVKVAAMSGSAHGDSDVVAADRAHRAGPGRGVGLARLAATPADQPIFYPVLNEDYATRIARDWNVKASGAGYVTRFDVAKGFLDRYEVQQVGGGTILEYWIPAGDLDELNASIAGRIEVVAEFH